MILIISLIIDIWTVDKIRNTIYTYKENNIQYISEKSKDKENITKVDYEP